MNDSVIKRYKDDSDLSLPVIKRYKDDSDFSLPVKKEKKESLLTRKRKGLIKSANFPHKQRAKIRPPSLKKLKKQMEFEFQDN